jgi:aldose 1-epimerase
MDVSPYPSGAQWTISDGSQRAVVVEVGGGLRRWQVSGADLLDGYGRDEICAGGAGQVLAPWPNRIRDGSYVFADARHQLPLSEPAFHNAIHGLVRWLPWQLVESTASSLTCECLLAAQPGYPWSLRLRTTWSLSPDGLGSHHEVTNLAPEPAPFGFSVHPYLYVPGTRVGELELHVPARTRLLSDARQLPVGAAKVEGGEWDFSTARPIGELMIDTAFTDLERDAGGGSAVTVRSPDGRGVRLWADQAFGWWQIFTGDTLPGARRRRSVAVEPMTCPPDAFRSGRDLITLEPGGSWRASWLLSHLVG